MSHAFDLTCYVITDTAMCGGVEGVVRTVEAAVDNGASFIQVRDPDASRDQFAELSRAVVTAVDGRVTVVLNDWVDLVAETGAHGAHIGQNDMDPREARRILGADAILGLSAQTMEQVRAANDLPLGTVDYLGLGPIFDQTTKPNAVASSGPDHIRALAEASEVPCVAIGGIKPGRLQTVRATGVTGFSVVSAVCAAEDPGAATRQLIEEWNQ